MHEELRYNGFIKKNQTIINLKNIRGGIFMYYPKQIPYLLDKPFQKYINYTEHHIKELEEYCMCIWQMKSKSKLEKTIYNLVLPDACIDIVIDFKTKTICFSGFSKDTAFLTLREEVDYMGVRFKPSAFYTIFHIEATKVMDHGIPFSAIENNNDLNVIFSCNEEDRLTLFKEYLIQKIKNHPDAKWIKIVDELYENPVEKTVSAIAQSFGYNKRQLYRIFLKYYGVSPKVLLNILRLHLCLTLLLEEKEGLSAIAHYCGFYDQSHFIKEIKKYTGISPIQLLENYKE